MAKGQSAAHIGAKARRVGRGRSRVQSSTTTLTASVARKRSLLRSSSGSSGTWDFCPPGAGRAYLACGGGGWHPPPESRVPLQLRLKHDFGRIGAIKIFSIWQELQPSANQLCRTLGITFSAAIHESKSSQFLFHIPNIGFYRDVEDQNPKNYQNKRSSLIAHGP